MARGNIKGCKRGKYNINIKSPKKDKSVILKIERQEESDIKNSHKNGGFGLYQDEII